MLMVFCVSKFLCRVVRRNLSFHTCYGTKKHNTYSLRLKIAFINDTTIGFSNKFISNNKFLGKVIENFYLESAHRRNIT